MIRNRLYYRIKPLVPAHVRMSVRRWFAVRKRERVLDTWPILPGSEKPPANWPGWPDGKKFAFVLTHDVEGQAGLDKCRQLMELEIKLGFRSSFNFIPEGEYQVPLSLIDDLKVNGFEIGVHDLHHDGKLYRNRQEFARKAARINEHLRNWKAVGFRSGFMLHNLEWLHDLETAYDASTFDTDPFEPQPDGVGTIFPFWVPAPNAGAESRVQSAKWAHANGNGSAKKLPLRTLHSELRTPKAGYVELPYTLPQDSTLFLLLRERHPDIWFQKLDWIAKHGGMALVNVHPDYLQFDGEAPSKRTFPFECYDRLLHYVSERYAEQSWRANPNQVAAHIADSKPERRPHPRRVCMVSYSHYLSDTRVVRYAEALANRGDHVDVLALQRSPDAPIEETLGSVRLVRIRPRFGKNERSKASYLLPILRFQIACTRWILREHRRNPYDLLHIHNVPDFLVYCAWLPKRSGSKVILDIHDIVPEFYASKFGLKDGRGSRSIEALRWLERISARVADHVIIANHLWLQKYATRTGANGKCSVMINNVDAEVFRPRPRLRDKDKYIVLFPGGLQWHQGLDIAICAFKKVSREIPQAEFHIYGDGSMKEALIDLTRELDLVDKVRFFDPIPIRQIAEIMANADMGVVPKRADSFGNEAYSTKIMEFMSLGVPVVVSSTKIDRYYFNDNVVRFFESGNPGAMADAMLEVIRDASLSRRLVENGLEYASLNSWGARKGDYLRLVDELCGSAAQIPDSGGSCPPLPDPQAAETCV